MARRQAVESVAPGVAVHSISALRADGLDALHPYLARGRTAVLLGSSGAGKSTLANALLGYERQAIREVRAHDGRGRHTTTTRELIALPSGGWIIDTPGLRELQLWADEGAAAVVFEDVAALAAFCRFRDCTHQAEPGCAVREAVASGELDSARLASHHKLERELHHLAAREDQAVRQAERRKRRTMHRAARRLYRTRDGGKRGG
jgi:ribosome biogenesis GTPase / thiamine phosphate phosphatase